jgi:FtsP/CotA-like multicopper oxidase with cupredoxin domain
MQAWDGLFGGILINGPATANYDEDLGNLFLNDWTHETAESLHVAVQTNPALELDNGLINGTNVYGVDGSPSQVGSRFEKSIEAGKSYLIRLVNGAIDTHFKFSIDNHTMTVIANDFVPVKPFEVETLGIGMG